MKSCPITAALPWACSQCLLSYPRIPLHDEFRKRLSKDPTPTTCRQSPLLVLFSFIVSVRSVHTINLWYGTLFSWVPWNMKHLHLLNIYSIQIQVYTYTNKCDGIHDDTQNGGNGESWLEFSQYFSHFHFIRSVTFLYLNSLIRRSKQRI